MTFSNPSTDDAYGLSPNSVGHDDEAAGVGLTQEKQALLAERVVGVVDGE